MFLIYFLMSGSSRLFGARCMAPDDKSLEILAHSVISIV